MPCAAHAQQDGAPRPIVRPRSHPSFALAHCLHELVWNLDLRRSSACPLQPCRLRLQLHSSEQHQHPHVILLQDNADAIHIAQHGHIGVRIHATVILASLPTDWVHVTCCYSESAKIDQCNACHGTHACNMRCNRIRGCTTTACGLTNSFNHFNAMQRQQCLRWMLHSLLILKAKQQRDCGVRAHSRLAL